MTRKHAQKRCARWSGLVTAAKEAATSGRRCLAISWCLTLWACPLRLSSCLVIFAFSSLVCVELYFAGARTPVYPMFFIFPSEYTSPPAGTLPSALRRCAGCFCVLVMLGKYLVLSIFFLMAVGDGCGGAGFACLLLRVSGPKCSVVVSRGRTKKFPSFYLCWCRHRVGFVRTGGGISQGVSCFALLAPGA